MNPYTTQWVKNQKKAQMTQETIFKLSMASYRIHNLKKAKNSKFYQNYKV